MIRSLIIAALDALPHAVVASERHEAAGGCPAWTAETWALEARAVEMGGRVNG